MNFCEKQMKQEAAAKLLQNIMSPSLLATHSVAVRSCFKHLVRNGRCNIRLIRQMKVVIQQKS